MRGSVSAKASRDRAAPLAHPPLAREDALVDLARRRAGRRRAGRGAAPGGAPRRSRAPRGGASPARRSRGRTGGCAPAARPASAGRVASRRRRCRRRPARPGATPPSACSTPSSAPGAARSRAAPQTPHGNVARSTSTLMAPVERRIAAGRKKFTRFGRRASRQAHPGPIGRSGRIRPLMPLPAAPDAPIFLIGFMGVGKDDGRAAAGRAAGLVVRRPGRPHRAGRRRDRRGDLRRARGRPASGGARPRRCARRRPGRRTVVATGGGAACREENLALMLASGRVVALDVSAAEAVRRTGSRSGRPLLDGSADPLARRAAAARRRASRSTRAPTCGSRPTGGRPRRRRGEIVGGLGLGLEAAPSTGEGAARERYRRSRRAGRAPLRRPHRRRSRPRRSPTCWPSALRSRRRRGSALLVDGGLAAHAARGGAGRGARRAAAPTSARLDLPRRRGLQEPDGDRADGRVAGRPRLRSPRRDRRHRRRRDDRPRRVRRGGLPARRRRSRTVPTTLLAMVDASVGGKTGVDLGGGEEPGRRVPPAARGGRRPRLPRHAAGARAGRGAGRGGQVRLHRRSRAPRRCSSRARRDAAARRWCASWWRARCA